MGEIKQSDITINMSKQPTPFGKEMARHFLFDPSYKNMNHGSFGTYPRVVRSRMRELQDAVEARPDQFIRYEYPVLVDQSREAVSKILNVPVDTVVFVPNATSGVNIVLRNLTWNPDGKDEILYFSFVYGACGKTIKYVCEANLDLVQEREIPVTFPFSHDGLIKLFKDAIASSKAAGHRPRLALFDTIVSQPGIRLPFERLTEVCRENDIFSLIDGAHGIGHIPLDLMALDPDFFVSNCHKWLFAPRGCAAFYVPERNQALMRSTMPTSHGFVPRGAIPDRGPLPANDKSVYISNFEFVGTVDNSPYLCVPEAIKFREEVCGGEQAIMDYLVKLSREGGKLVAEKLGTRTLDNEEGTLSECAMTNILLPISEPGLNDGEFPLTIKSEDRVQVVSWMLQTSMDEYKTYIPISVMQGGWWVRLSAQVYLDKSDFEWAGNVLLKLCERVANGDHLTQQTPKEAVTGGDLAKEGADGII